MGRRHGCKGAADRANGEPAKLALKGGRVYWSDLLEPAGHAEPAGRP